MLHEGVQPFLSVGPLAQCFDQSGIVNAERLGGSVLAAMVALFPLREEIEQPVIPVIARRGRYFAALDLGLEGGLRVDRRVDVRIRHPAALRPDAGLGLGDGLRIPLGVQTSSLCGGCTGLSASLESGGGL